MRKKVHTRFLLVVSVVFIVYLSCLGHLFGSSVPVYRYALERWPSEPYVVTIFYNGKINQQQKKVINYYEKFAGTQGVITLSAIDLSNRPLFGDALRFSQNYIKKKLPAVLVEYPIHSRIKVIVGIYPLNMNSAVQIMESPARRELARRLLNDDSAIFMQIDGIDPKENAKCERIVLKALKQMNVEFKLPHEELGEGATLDEESLKYDTDKLNIKFSFLRISKQSKADKIFIDILLNSEKGLKQIEGPLIFPVYGRARVLFAFSQDGINIENMKDAGAFLVKPCSHEAKDQNPGLDLLLPVSWDNFFKREGDQLTGITSTILDEYKNELFTIENVDLKKNLNIKNETLKKQFLVKLILTLVALIFLFAIVAVLMKKRKS